VRLVRETGKPFAQLGESRDLLLRALRTVPVRTRAGLSRAYGLGSRPEDAAVHLSAYSRAYFDEEARSVERVLDHEEDRADPRDVTVRVVGIDRACAELKGILLPTDPSLHALIQRYLNLAIPFIILLATTWSTRPSALGELSWLAAERAGPTDMPAA